jgi:protein phosphatase
VIELILPDPSLVVLIGAAGAGKTTFAARHFEPAEILSSDAYRALIAGDESDQRATRAAFARLHRALERRLADRLLTVVDATNVERSARRALLVRAVDAGLSATAIVLDLPPATIVARNAGRSSRIVDERVVRRHLERLRHSLDGPGARLRDEGFRQIIILRDPLELDELRIVRRSARPADRPDRPDRPDEARDHPANRQALVEGTDPDPAG